VENNSKSDWTSSTGGRGEKAGEFISKEGGKKVTETTNKTDENTTNPNASEGGLKDPTKAAD